MQRKARIIICLRCGVSVTTIGSKTKRCVDCRKLGWKLYKKNRTWETSEVGRAYMKAYHVKHSGKFKVEVFNKYGWLCNCCGETMKSTLTIDHVNNDGYLDRRNKVAGVTLYRKIIKESFPNKYQILCMNCNWSKKILKGICEHKITK